MLAPLDRPAFIDTLLPGLELSLQSRVDIQVIKGIQFDPMPPDPTGSAWTARAFGLDSAGWQRDGDLSVRVGGGALRTRGFVRTGGLLTITAKALAGAGADLDGAIDSGVPFDHELPTDEVEVVLTAGIDENSLGGQPTRDGSHETLQPYSGGILGRWGVSMQMQMPRHQAREAAVGALYDALDARGSDGEGRVRECEGWVIMRDGGRSLTGNPFGERAPRADCGTGGRLIGRGGASGPFVQL